MRTVSKGFDCTQMEEASPKDYAIGVVMDSLKIGQNYKLIVEKLSNCYMSIPSQPWIEQNMLLRRRGKDIAASFNFDFDEL